ncbi:hypothetical protein FA15DRAFT_675894 [Coprinopsis marcescibilis]|uniref:Uncharacterized protein n=1 Tax=Coprinopsis marcescibilis TaxID=230819 RepID=A0A5C3KC94_COPMA|nr:hypothetical protein FA15DRAFT_675894 [Coprinopsis marcescibilis]
MSNVSRKFEGLPDELWAHIVSYPDLLEPRETLLNLATTSRQLYRISLLAYLKHLGNPLPHARLSIQLSRANVNTGGGAHPWVQLTCDALTALRLPYLITHTAELVCTFPKAGSIVHPCNRLIAALDQFDAVEDVKLDFNGNKDTQGGSSMAEWSDTLSRLLNTLLEKGCKELEISGLTEIVKDYVHIPRPAPTPPRWTVPNPTVLPPDEAILQGPEWRFERVSSSPHIIATLSPLARQRTRLQCLSVNLSPVLAQPPLLQWLYSALLASSRAGTFKALKIEHFVLTSDICPWSRFSTFIAQAVGKNSNQQLEALELHRIGSSTRVDFVAWLEEFPFLKRLALLKIHLPSALDSQGWPEGRPPPYLKHLEQLVLTMSWFNHMWAAKDLQTRFPKLQELTVLFEQQRGFTTQIGDGTVREQFQWLSKQYKQGIEGKRFLPYRVTLKFTFDATTIACFHDAPTYIGGWFDCVEKVVLAVTTEAFDQEQLVVGSGSVVGQALSMFKNLQSLSITSTSELARGGARTLADHLAARKTKLHLTHFEVDGEIRAWGRKTDDK